jgi:hypothetical protein
MYLYFHEGRWKRVFHRKEILRYYYVVRNKYPEGMLRTKWLPPWELRNLQTECAQEMDALISGEH